MNREIKFRAFDKTLFKMFEPRTLRDIAKEAPNNGVNWYQFEMMQFTGLTDKNGKDIYEGDILVCGPKDTRYHREVIWRDGMFVLLPNRGVFYDYIMSGEIVGNIHENPELMEG
jgi:hypothetical protein